MSKLELLPATNTHNERYVNSFARRGTSDGGWTEPYVPCARTRCNNNVAIFEATLDDRKTLMFDYETIIISINGGNSRHAFCSEKCAAQWLTAYSRKNAS